jgi:hypothetical protein
LRYYQIRIQNPNTGAAVLPSSLGGLSISSLLPGGGVNVAALQIELDIPVAAQHAPAGQAFLRIWGLGLKDIGNAFNLNGMNISISAGMSAGLPLANPSQARLLVKGRIFQAFGNWVGTEQTVDLLLTPPAGTTNSPANYVLSWKAGTTLADALSTTFATALPTAKQNITISSRLKLNYDVTGYYESLVQFASWLNEFSKSIITDAGYLGVTIDYSDGDTINVMDFTGPPSPVKAIAFQDLIGQPTWIEPSKIQAKCVMRGDINLGDMVSLPQSLVTTTAQAMTSFAGTQNPSNSLTFSGNYLVTDIHHYGNFRQPDAASWNTTLNMVLPPKAVAS